MDGDPRNAIPVVLAISVGFVHRDVG